MVENAAVIIVGVEGSGVLADSTGVFSLPDVKPGIFQFSAIQLGYRTIVTPEYKITPYTPYDEITSSLRSVWDAAGRPVYDYTQYNAMRLDPYWQLDLRVDKNFYFDKWTLGLYVDLQNVTFSKIRQPDAYLNTGTISNPDVPVSEQRYELELLELYSGTIVPAIGITFEF